MRRAATARERLGVATARAGRRVADDDSTVTAGSAVCASALSIAKATSPMRKAAPINQCAWRSLKLVHGSDFGLHWLLVVTSIAFTFEKCRDCDLAAVAYKFCEAGIEPL